MAKEPRQKKLKFPIPTERATAILNMDPKLLPTEIARMEVRIEEQKKQNKEDPEFIKLSDLAQTLEDEIIADDPEVKKLQAQLEEVKQKLKETIYSDKLFEAKEDLKAWKKGINGPLNLDKKELKFMLETFKKHLHSGAIKLQN